jgi:hypothetical protein
MNDLLGEILASEVRETSSLNCESLAAQARVTDIDK